MEPIPADSPSGATNPTASPTGGHGRLPLVLGVAGAVLLTDVLTKVAVVAWIEGHAPVKVLGGFLTLRVIRNPGAAFSVGTGLTLVLSLVAIAVVVFVVRQSRRLQSTAWALTFGVLLGGALGNLACRTFREPGFLRGHVVDWIELPHYPLFNVADSAITLAGVSIVVLTIRGVPLEGRGRG